MTEVDRKRRLSLCTRLDDARRKLELVERRLSERWESTPEFMSAQLRELEDAERTLFVVTQEIADVYL